MAVFHTTGRTYVCDFCGATTILAPKVGQDLAQIESRLDMEWEGYSDGTCLECIAKLELPAADLAPLPAGRGR